MANNFNILSTKFYNQYRNDDGTLSFALNLTEFNNRLQGNVGEIVQLIQEVEVSTIVNEDEIIPITFHELAFTTFGKFSAIGINFINQGLYPGATVQIEFDGGTVVTNVQVQTITGTGNNEWTFDSTDRTALLAAFPNVVSGTETRNDIVIKVTSAPTYLRYEYGINTSSFSESANLYQSNIDDNTQTYYLDAVPTTPTFGDMNWTGSQIGADLGTVKANFIGTVEIYKHQFTIKHTFKIPYYVAGEQDNLINGVNPSNLLSASTYKYDNRYKFGESSLTTAIFPILGLEGNVGYFGENFNGQSSDYTIENLVITNASDTGTLEATEANTVTFDVVSAGGNWTTSVDKLIFTHTKLPKADEYENKTTAYDINWIFENITVTVDAAPVAGTLFSAFEAVIAGGDPVRLNVTIIITYSGSQQILISDLAEYLLFATVAHNDLSSPALMDRVNPIVKVDNYSKNSDVSGLITLNDLQFYPPWASFGGSKKYTDFSGGDGDLWGLKATWKTNLVIGSLIETFRFKIIMENAATGEIFEMLSIPISIGKIFTFFDGTNTHQQEITDILGSFNLPATEELNRLKIEAFKPPLASPTQDWEAFLGFQTPWREWIENLAVFAGFYDVAEPNNNLNFKSSQYAGVDGFLCYGVVELGVLNNVQEEPTTYNLYSHPSTLLDFDSASWALTSVSTSYEDQNGDPVTDVTTTDDIIVKVDIPHTLGILLLADIKGFVWAERAGSTIKPHYLSTSKDWTSSANTMKPTDILATGNNTLVEVVSVNNLVTFIFQTEKNNITPDISYNFYGRMYDPK